MASSMTLLDIAKRNGADNVVGLIDETTKYHPEIALAPARTIKGTSYKTWIRVALPTSAFRKANQGVTNVATKYVNRVVETFILNPRWLADVAVADRAEDGAMAYLANEGMAIVEASMQTLAKQFYYGAANGGDTLGHPGLLDAYDSTNMSVDAGGTTSATGSSCWLVKFGPQHVQWVYGENGMLNISDVTRLPALDASSNEFTAYRQELLAYPGLQVGSVRSTCRIKKLTADSGKGLTDSLISQALSKFQVGVVPDAILCSRRSRQQLQQSRSVTIFSGMGVKATPNMENIAAIPESAFGIPLYVTDAILDTESLTL